MPSPPPAPPGTELNGEWLDPKKPVALKAGDLIVLGKVATLRVEISPVPQELGTVEQYLEAVVDGLCDVRSLVPCSVCQKESNTAHLSPGDIQEVFRGLRRATGGGGDHQGRVAEEVCGGDLREKEAEGGDMNPAI